MIVALIGMIGLLLGILLGEYFRRSSRIELCSKEIFQKRLQIYEELYRKIGEATRIADDIIENPKYSKDERKELLSEVIFDLAEYTDENSLYINDDVAVHCIATWMGVENIYYIKDSKEKQKELEKFRNNCSKITSIIRKETGLERIEKLFRAVSKPKYRSDIINYYRDVKKKIARKRKG